MRFLRGYGSILKPAGLLFGAVVGGWIVITYEPPPPPAWRPIQLQEVEKLPLAETSPLPSQKITDERQTRIASTTAVSIEPKAVLPGLFERLSTEPSPPLSLPNLVLERPEIASTTEPDTFEGEDVASVPSDVTEPAARDDEELASRFNPPPPVIDLPAVAPVDRLQAVRRGRNVGEPAYVTIIIDDLGLNTVTTAKIADLPGPLTLSFLPYGRNLDQQSALVKSRGHEVFVHLPMEPIGDQDPGPNAIHSGQSTDEVRRLALNAIGAVSGAAGLNNHMGSRATTDGALVRPVLDAMQGTGLVFIDSFTTSVSIAETMALEAGLPASRRDVFLDNDPSPEAIHTQLMKLEDHARAHGTAIGIGHPYPTTIAAIREWSRNLRANDLNLIPASKLVEIRMCKRNPTCRPAGPLIAQREVSPRNACNLGYC